MTHEQIDSARRHATALLQLLADVDAIEKREDTADARISVGLFRALMKQDVQLCDQLLTQA